MASLTKASLALAQAPVPDAKPPRTRNRKKREARPPTPIDIIVLSSDEDEAPVAPVRKQKRKRNGNKDGRADGNDNAGTGTGLFTMAKEGAAPWDPLADAESSEMARLRKENEALKRVSLTCLWLQRELELTIDCRNETATELLVIRLKLARTRRRLKLLS